MRSPGQSPVGINYTQASGRQSLQLASSAHGRGLPCLPTVSYSLLTPVGPQLPWPAGREPRVYSREGDTLGLIPVETGYGELRRPWARVPLTSLTSTGVLRTLAS